MAVSPLASSPDVLPLVLCRFVQTSAAVLLAGTAVLRLLAWGTGRERTSFWHRLAWGSGSVLLVASAFQLALTAAEMSGQPLARAPVRRRPRNGPGRYALRRGLESARLAFGRGARGAVVDHGGRTMEGPAGPGGHTGDHGRWIGGGGACNPNVGWPRPCISDQHAWLLPVRRGPRGRGRVLARRTFAAGNIAGQGAPEPRPGRARR